MNNFRAELKPSEQFDIGESDVACFWEKATHILQEEVNKDFHKDHPMVVAKLAEIQASLYTNKAITTAIKDLSSSINFLAEQLSE
jgi:hypothetical protein